MLSYWRCTEEMEDREEKRKEGVQRESGERKGDRRKYVGKEDNQREKLKWETIRSRREDRNRKKKQQDKKRKTHMDYNQASFTLNNKMRKLVM